MFRKSFPDEQLFELKNVMAKFLLERARIMPTESGRKKAIVTLEEFASLLAA